MEKHVVIAPVGDNMGSLFIGIREVATERVVLISPAGYEEETKKAVEDLEKFKIPVQVKNVKGHVWEAVFQAVSEIKKVEKDMNVIVNVATGDRDTTCAATSAAFVNGIKAFSVSENKTMLLPVLKFSYYKMLTDKKLALLKLLYEPDCCHSLEQLSKKSGMSLPLVSYHINGNLKSEGLKSLGLVVTEEKKGRG